MNALIGSPVISMSYRGVSFNILILITNTPINRDARFNFQGRLDDNQESMVTLDWRITSRLD